MKCGFCRFYRTNKFCMSHSPYYKSCSNFKEFKPEQAIFRTDKIYVQILEDKDYKLFEVVH